MAHGLKSSVVLRPEVLVARLLRGLVECSVSVTRRSRSSYEVKLLLRYDLQSRRVPCVCVRTALARSLCLSRLCLSQCLLPCSRRPGGGRRLSQGRVGGGARLQGRPGRGSCGTGGAPGCRSGDIFCVRRHSACTLGVSPGKSAAVCGSVWCVPLLYPGCRWFILK